MADGRWDYEWGRGGGECGVQPGVFGIRLRLGTQALCVILQPDGKGDAVSSWLRVRVILQNSLGLAPAESCGRPAR